MIAAPAADSPPTPNAKLSVNKWRPRISGLASKALQCASVFRVELNHLPGDVRQRDLAKLLHNRVDLRSCAQIGIVGARIDRPVEVCFALSPARQQTLLIET